MKSPGPKGIILGLILLIFAALSTIAIQKLNSRQNPQAQSETPAAEAP